MTEIVIGVDGGAAARNALHWGLERGARTGLPVTALHVWATPVQVEVPLGVEAAALLADDVGSASDVRVTVAARSGDPGPVLVERSREAALLVVGAARRRSLDPRGSVPSYCLRHSRTPVAVVPADRRGHPDVQVSRVAVGVDLSPGSAAALRWASREALLRGDRLAVSYAWQAPAAMTDLAHHAHLRQETGAAQELAAWVHGVLGPGPWPEISLHVDRGVALDALLAHASRSDVLVLGWRHHHPLARLLVGSTSGQLSLLCACPVVVVPPRNGDGRGGVVAA